MKAERKVVPGPWPMTTTENRQVAIPLQDDSYADGNLKHAVRFAAFLLRAVMVAALALLAWGTWATYWPRW